MKIKTRLAFAAYVSQIALVNSVPTELVSDPSKGLAKFNVDPTVEQTLEGRIRNSSEFLQMINVMPVEQQEGEVLGIGVSTSLAGRTDTDVNRRDPQNVGGTNRKHRYFCKQTEYDWSRKYPQIDAWAHLPNFETILRDDILAQQALDRIIIGFHGVEAAPETDRAANPMLQDVNEGWLFKIRRDAPAQVMDDGNLTVHSDGSDDDATKAIYVADDAVLYDLSTDNATDGEADYASLDAVVLDGKRGIHERHSGDNDLVAIVGHNLLDDKYFNIAQKTGATATEQEATDRILASTKMIGGLQAYRVSGFPANAILITKLSNLSIYVQEGSRRRNLKDEPEYNRIANYESVNEAFVVEEYELAVLIENIVIGKAPARPAP